MNKPLSQTKTSIKKILKYGLSLCEHILLLFPRPNTKSSLLLVRLDRIGDFILWLDAAHSYRKIYSGSHIVLIANSLVSGLASEFDCWDEVWPVSTDKFKHNLLYRWSIMFRVHQAGFKTAIQPTFSREFLSGDSLIRASRAVHRIGSSGDLTNIRPQEKKLSDKWYTHLTPAINQTLMEFDRNAEFLEGIGFTFSSGLNSKLACINKNILRLKLPANYFVIFPGASNFNRAWPSSRYADVAHYIYRNTGWAMVICGTSNESHFADQIIRCVGINAFDLTGKTSLPELVQVIKSSRLLVGNDTSGVHIAAAVRTPSVCILGGPISGRFIPYSSNYPYVKPVPVYSKTSLNSVSVKMVEDALDDLLLKT